MFAQVDTTNVLVVHDFRRGPLRKHSAIVDDEGVVTNAQSLAHVVVCDQNTNASGF